MVTSMCLSGPRPGQLTLHAVGRVLRRTAGRGRIGLGCLVVGAKPEMTRALGVPGHLPDQSLVVSRAPIALTRPIDPQDLVEARNRLVVVTGIDQGLRL